MSNTANIVARFKQYISEHKLLNKDDRVLLAVSGGVDSTVMCDLFSRCDFIFGIAHCNFKLREAHSDTDEKFVKDLARTYRVPFFSASFDTKNTSKKKGISTQMAARELRYGWLEKIRKENNFYFIATAHHKNDNVETVILNLVKGTGIAGLHGILSKNDKIIRPLLGCSKDEIQKYVLDQNLTFMEDHTNLESVYQRNKIRLEVIPKLQEMNPSFIDTFSNNIQRFTDVELIYEKGFDYYKKKLIEKRGSEIYIPIKKLIQFPAVKTLLFQILNDYGFNQQQSSQVFDSLNEESGKQFISQDFRIIKDRSFLIIAKKSEEDSGYILVESLKKQTKLKDGTLHYHLKKNSKIGFDKNPNIAYLDYSKLEFPLLLRKWKQGDYFYPFGITKNKSTEKIGKKKLSDFFIDLKLSLIEKEKVWIMESNKKVAWVVGYRIDDRFKITSSTKQVLTIKSKK